MIDQAKMARGKRMQALSNQLLDVIRSEIKAGSQEEITFALQALVGTTFAIMMKVYGNIESRAEFRELYNETLDEIISVMTPLSEN